MKEKLKIKNRLYFLGLGLIFFLAIFLRFYKINERWSLDFDPARDAMVGHEALKLKKIPQIGAFSSAGPFVWGPIYYWEIMLAYFFAPNFAYAPWVLYTLLDLILILVMIKIGEKLWGPRGGLVFGLITSLSPGQLFRTSLVNQPTLVPFFGSLAILNLILYLKSQKSRFLLFSGLSIGFALNSHFQALNFCVLGLAVFFSKKLKIKKIFIDSLFFLTGIILPLFPLMYWDSHQEWKNIRNVLDFFLIGQYRFWVSNRWLTYAGVYWPKLWGDVLGGLPIFGYLLMGLMVIFIVYELLKKKIFPITLLLLFVFAILVFLNRYYRGVRFEGYMLYFYPFILFFSGYVIIQLLKFNRFLGITFLILISFFSLKADYKVIGEQRSPGQPRIILKNAITELKKAKPGEKFQLYDYKYLNSTPSMVASFLLSFENLIDEKEGTKLGFASIELPYPKILTINGINSPTHIYDLNTSWNEATFDKNGWINVSPQYVCYDILEWWKVKEFNSYFSLTKYIQVKFFGKTF